MSSVRSYSEKANFTSREATNRQGASYIGDEFDSFEQKMSALMNEYQKGNTETKFAADTVKMPNQESKDLETLITELELRHKALTQSMQKGAINKDAIRDLASIHEQLDKVNDNFLTLALKIVENTNKALQEQHADNDEHVRNAQYKADTHNKTDVYLPTEENKKPQDPSKDTPKDPLEALLQKSLVGSGQLSVPKNASDFLNPLEVREKKDKSIHGASVRFVDKYTQKEVEIPLDEDNAKRLTEHFGSLEKAKGYIEGWYYEAAYAVGYLEFDSDGNGILSKDEAKNLKALVALNGEPPTNYRSLNEALAGDEAKMDSFLDEFGFIDSLSAFINSSIRKDKDTSGTLEFRELTGNNSKKVAEAIINKEVSDIFSLHRLIIGEHANNDDLLLSIFGGVEAQSESAEKDKSTDTAQDLKKSKDTLLQNNIHEHNKQTRTSQIL